MPASPSASGPMTAGSIMCRWRARAYNNGPNIDFYALGMILLGISTTVGAINFIVTFLRMRAPGMSINRVPILIWGTLTAIGRQHLRHSGGEPGVLPAVDGPQSRHAFLRRDGRRLSRCCGSICSGCSAIPGSMPSCCRPWAWCRTACRCSAAGRWSATPLVALATVATMVLGFGVWVHHMFATGLPEHLAVLLQRRLHHHRGAERGGRVRLAGHHLDGTAGLHHAVPVLRQLHPAVHHRRRLAAT